MRLDVLVGGPYVVLISLDPGSEDSSDVTGPWGVADQRTLDVVEYWLQNNVGADFLVVDASTETRQDTAFSPVEGAQKFADMAAWLQQRSDLPIWWAEFYPQVPEGRRRRQPANAAVTLAAVAAMAESETAGALLWGPHGHGLDSAALWTDATEDDGGEPTPLTESVAVPGAAAGRGRGGDRSLPAPARPAGLPRRGRGGRGQPQRRAGRANAGRPAGALGDPRGRSARSRARA